MAALPPLALRREGPGLSINDLTDDLLSAVLAAVRDSTQLRAVASTCRRWAALLRDRLELWHEVQLALPPKRSRGRDRCGSAAWLPGLRCVPPMTCCRALPLNPCLAVCSPPVQAK